jgi:glycosyltransferase involved in cell wall biosynthesis
MLITIYIPTFNRLNLLKRALKSALNQSYPKVEVIVVDDGSVDGTIEYMLRLQENIRNVTFVQKDAEAKGAPASRNLAIRLAKGRLVTGLDDDDYFHPKRLELLLSCYDESYAAIASNYYCLSKGHARVNSRVGRIVHVNDLYNLNVIGNQVLVARDRVLEVGGYDENLAASQDVDLWIRLSKKYGKIRRIARPLYYLDMSHDQSRISISENRRLGTLQFISKHKPWMTANQIEFRMRHLSEVRQKKSIINIPELFQFGFHIGLERVRTKLKLG